jgi:hypothetical protein
MYHISVILEQYGPQITYMSAGDLAGWPTNRHLPSAGCRRENIEYALHTRCKFTEITWIHSLDVGFHYNTTLTETGV